MKAVLHDSVNACSRSLTCASLSALWNTSPSTVAVPGQLAADRGVSPWLISAVDVITLNVEPGGKPPSMAWSNPPELTDTAASTAPVEAFTATSAALFFSLASAASAARCTDGSIVVVTGLPGCGGAWPGSRRARRCRTPPRRWRPARRPAGARRPAPGRSGRPRPARCTARRAAELLRRHRPDRADHPAAQPGREGAQRGAGLEHRAGERVEGRLELGVAGPAHGEDRLEEGRMGLGGGDRGAAAAAGAPAATSADFSAAALDPGPLDADRHHLALAGQRRAARARVPRRGRAVVRRDSWSPARSGGAIVAGDHFTSQCPGSAPGARQT